MTPLAPCEWWVESVDFFLGILTGVLLTAGIGMWWYRRWYRATHW